MDPAYEDTIQCYFFSNKEPTSISWEHLSENINTEIRLLTQNYIWHRDEFQVHVPPLENKLIGVPHLASVTCFGDNIEDEWFIVYLLFELTKTYKDLIIQVVDTDGNFLFIEAADQLPSWANPENTENRVFIHNNHIHVITPNMVSLQSELKLEDAIQLLIQYPESTQAPSNIEQAISDRIGKYPEKALDNIHTVIAKLPRDLATILTMKHSLIAPIVDSYCNHDVINTKCCRNIKFDDCINVKVKFTKFLYAKLQHSKLIPFVKHHTQFQNDKTTIISFKLLCGYQMIMDSSKSDLFNSKHYTQYISNLTKHGYFQNNIAGSKDYNELLNKAKNYFLEVECPLNSHVKHKILELISSDEFSKLKEVIGDDCIEETDNVEDNENWLNINPVQLNDLLESRYGKKLKIKNNDVISPDVITKELSNFLKQTSDFEGIEPTKNEAVNDIDFEPNEFVAGLEKMLRILSMDNDNHDAVNNSCSEDDFDDSISCSDDDCDKELKVKLQSDQINNKQDSRTILTNIVQSMKEEKASSGPSSNLFRSFGMSKSDFLDSDDDE